MPTKSTIVSPGSEPPAARRIASLDQRAGSLSYLTFGAGLATGMYAMFVWVGDVHGLRIGVWRTLGANALAGYVIHEVVDQLIKPFTPRGTPLGGTLLA